MMWFLLFVAFDLIGAGCGLLAVNLYDDWHKASVQVMVLTCLGGLTWGVSVACLFIGVCSLF